MKSGSRHHQGLLYDRYADFVYYKCLGLVSDREAARDLAHDVMIKVFVNIEKLRHHQAITNWIGMITHNTCINYLTKTGRHPTEELDEERAEEVFSQADDELAAKLLLEIKLEQLQRLFTKLSEAEKMILLMRYREGMKIERIASVLEMKTSAVKMRLKRSRDHLANLFEIEGNDER